MNARILSPAAVFAALLLTSAGAASADRGGDNQGVIVAERFSARNGGNPEIVAVDPTTGHLRVLTTGNADFTPDLSPDGRMVVFQRCPGAVRCDEIGVQNIWVMRSDGSHQHPVTSCDGTKCLGAFGPSFSPDGRRIAFSEDRLDEHGVNFNGIFTMRLDGTDLRRVTSRASNEGPDGSPQFSPDGKRLVFSREVPGASRLFTVGVDGRDLRPLLPEVNGSTPAWSPNGHRIAFTRATGTGTDFAFSILSVRPNGRHARVVTDALPGTPTFQPDYSPSGHRLVFSQSVADGNGCHLVITTARGRHSRTLPTGPGCLAEPSWGVNPAAGTP